MTAVTDAPATPAPLHDPAARGFASDNSSGVHPEVLEAIARANGGHQHAYGADVHTARLQEVFRAQFGVRVRAYPVFNGTGANVVSLMSVTERWDAVICTDLAHIHVDECGAPERVGGLKLLPVPASDAKLTPELVDRQAHGFGDAHPAQPKVVSVTQSREVGTVYTPAELSALVEHAHELGLVVHLDGARVANAAAALGVPLRAITTDAGVDIVSFGGTKNGLLYGECVLVLNPDVVRGVEFVRKASMQLASKMRFVSAQFEALLAGDLWLRNASHSNAMARRLRDAVSDVAGLQITQPVEANMLFAELPAKAAARLQEHYPFYVVDEARGLARWVTSYDTTEEDVDGFAAAIRAELGG